MRKLRRNFFQILYLIFLTTALAYGAGVQAHHNFSSQKSSINTIHSASSAFEKIKIYQQYQGDGLVSFSDKPPQNGNFQVVLYTCAYCRSDKNQPQSKVEKFGLVIHQAADTYQLEHALIRAVIHVESNFNPKALSPAGAMGLMQLMPPTAKELGVEDAFDAKANIFAGSAYLAKMLKRFDGDMEKALAAYNAGPANVIKYKGIPPFKETRNYVKRVQSLLKQYRGE